MSPNNQDDPTKQQEKQPTQVTTTGDISAVAVEAEDQTSASLVLERTCVTSSRGKERFHAGAKYAGFVDIALDTEPADGRDEPQYEFIDERDTVHEGQQHRSYNGQSDHVRKYPSDFGKEAK